MLTVNPIRQRLATGAALAALAVGMAFGLVGGEPYSAHAEPKRPVDNGVRCSVQTGPGSFEFYLPGETIPVVDASGHWHYYQCMESGGWIEVNPAIQTTPIGERPRLTTSTATLQR